MSVQTAKMFSRERLTAEAVVSLQSVEHFALNIVPITFGTSTIGTDAESQMCQGNASYVKKNLSLAGGTLRPTSAALLNVADFFKKEKMLKSGKNIGNHLPIANRAGMYLFLKMAFGRFKNTVLENATEGRRQSFIVNAMPTEFCYPLKNASGAETGLRLLKETIGRANSAEAKIEKHSSFTILTEKAKPILKTMLLIISKLSVTTAIIQEPTSMGPSLILAGAVS